MLLAAGDVTDFLSVNLTTIIGTWLNFLILFFVLKHFLFDRVNKIIEQRKEDVENSYKDADTAKENAEKLEVEYREKLAQSKEESARIIADATTRAQVRSDEIINDAKVEAKNITDKARDEIDKEKKIAVNQIKDDITDIAFEAASAVVEKDMTTEDNRRLIESFIDNVGDA